MKKNRIESLEGLRVLAFLGIFISHIGLYDWGAWGVSIFLVLSGFLMVYNYYDNDLPDDVKGCLMCAVNRVKKLYPLHIVTMIAAIVVQSLHGIIFYSIYRSIIDAGIVGLHLCLLQSWIPRSGVYFSLNSVSWFLGVSLFCYFMFPYICKRIKKYDSGKEAIIAVIFTFVAQIILAYGSTFIHVPEAVSKDFTKWFTYVCPLFRLGDFIIGCNLGFIFLSRKTEVKSLHSSTWTLMELSVLILGLSIPNDRLYDLGFGWIAVSIVYLPVSAALVLLFSLKLGFFTKISSVLKYVGSLTPYAFLIHFQVINDWQMLTRCNKWVDMAVCLILTAFLSIIWRIMHDNLKKARLVGGS